MGCLVDHRIVRDRLFLAAIAWSSGRTHRLLPIRVRAGERQRCCTAAAWPCRHSGLGNHGHGHVSSWRLDAYRWQHAVFVDFWRQCRRFDGACAVRDLLCSMRHRGGAGPIYDRPRLDDADGRGVGRHCRHPWRLSDIAPSGRCANLHADHHFRAVYQPAGLACSRRLDRRSVRGRSQRAGRRRWRRCLFRAYRRLHCRHVPCAVLQAQRRSPVRRERHTAGTLGRRAHSLFRNQAAGALSLQPPGQ